MTCSIQCKVFQKAMQPIQTLLLCKGMGNATETRKRFEKHHFCKFSCSFSINLYKIWIFCLFTRVYLQYYCICLQQYWRLVLQFIFNNFVIWCKIFAMKNLFFNPITKKLQSSTTSILDFKQQLPILAGHGTRTHDLWVASPVPYPFLHEISY